MSSDCSQESLSNTQEEQSFEVKKKSSSSMEEIEWKKNKKKSLSGSYDGNAVDDDDDGADYEIKISGSKLIVTDTKKSTTEAALDPDDILSKRQQQESSSSSSMTRDLSRLKSATLDRMGKMLKIHSKSSGEKPDGAAAESASGEDAATMRKQKFNSLTRMLRLGDKEDKSKSAGQQQQQQENRGHSLTRILRRKATVEADNPSDKPDEHVRGLFSRILGQIRGRFSKTDTSEENSSQKNKEKVNLSKSPTDSALSELTLEGSCPVMASRQQAK